MIVINKATGIVLPLKESPKITELGQWLAQNPQYEPVKPGSAQAEIILNRNKSSPQARTPTQAAVSPVKTPTAAPSGEDLFSNPVKINTGANSTPVAVKKQVPARSNVPTKATSTPTAVKSPAARPLPVSSEKKLKRQVSEEKPSSKPAVDSERQNIRTTLVETIKKRMETFDHPTIPKMSESEIVTFAKEVEKEMHLLGKDKYKAKYRSLKFNLGDMKNKTLVERICGKKILPKQLVHLSAADLASEELSKWRESENKHQLEIITKSELDALSQTKIVVKTHKGEEIIEQKTAPVETLIPTIDDVESVIAKNVLSVEDHHSRYDLSKSSTSSRSGTVTSPSHSSSTSRKSDSHRTRSRSKSRGRDSHHHHHKSSSSSKKEKKSERHRSRSRHRDKDRKSRERSKSRHKHRHGRSKSKEKSKSSSDSLSKSKETKKTPVKSDEPSSTTKEFKIQPEKQDADLVGAILSQMGVKLDTPIVPPAVEEKPKPEVVAPTTKHEPVSLVPELPQEIEIYSGNIHMSGVTSFNVSGYRVSGGFDDILKFFTPQLEVVGRIEPSTVIDYLGKATKFPGKELSTIRFTSDDEVAFNKFFDYLCSMHKYGVIKLESNVIKDFYLFTIKPKEPLPSILLPLKNAAVFRNEAERPNMLIGVILKTVEVKVRNSSRLNISQESLLIIFSRARNQHHPARRW